MFDTIAIVGIGLIGGSLAAALKQAGVVKTVIGIDRNQQALSYAFEQGFIDRYCREIKQLPKSTELIVLATPVRQTLSLLSAVDRISNSEIIVTDVASVKGEVVECARKILKNKFSQFVPAHPIAGSEQSGIGAARANLFDGKIVVLTPTEKSNRHAVKRVTQLWQACGAKLIDMNSNEHDIVYAGLSHLPHLLSALFVNSIAQSELIRSSQKLAGSGYRDFTRIAGSDPDLWADILLSNRSAVLDFLDQYIVDTVALRKALQEKETDVLRQLFISAKRVLSCINQE